MNLKLFKKRLIVFYSCWRKNRRDLWGNSDVLVICTPPSDSCHPISSFFFRWLVGHDFPDTIAIFSRNEIYFICIRKSSVLPTLAGPAMEAVQARVRVYSKSKGDERLELMDGIIRGIRVTCKAKDESIENQPFIIGHISGESPKSKLFWSCYKNMMPRDFLSARVDGFSRLLNHDQDEKYSGKSRERSEMEFDESNSKLGFGSRRGNCEEIQMLSLPHEFEQMLALTPERKSVEALSKTDDKKPQLENGKGDAQSLQPREGGGSSECGLGGDEDDEWVFC